MNTSPFFIKPTPLQVVMLKVVAALLPGIIALTWAFGVGVLVQIALALLTALLAEAACLKLRNYPIKPFILDGSAAVTALLLALSMPPLAPWWVVVLASLIAICLAKHLYGGLGQNPFNPAMVGFAVMIVSFPAQMSRWAAPLALDMPHLDSITQVITIFSGAVPAAFDAMASATPLDTIKTGLKAHQALPDVMGAPLFGNLAGVGSEWAAAGFLLGGLYLLRAKLIPWQIPVGFLGAFMLTASVFYGIDPANYSPPWFHLFSGAAILGAFFIVSDPVTAPTTPRGRLIFAALAGLLTYMIRVFGAYPDGVAFAVLIMNIATPFIDQYTQPPVFGRKAKT
ncbi:MAG: hypothetical protein RL571_987 [Pseudomonadota bacterium]|jgi:electron transport complex protein RnfD